MANYNHTYYEDLLLSREALKPDEKRELEMHLQECESCRQLAVAWREVERQLSSAPALTPQPGFTTRWLKRLEEDNQKVHRRQTFAILLFCVGGAALLMVSLSFLLLPAPGSSKIYFLAWVFRIMSEITLVSGVGAATSAFIQTFFKIIPLYGWLLMIGIASELAVIWFVTIRFLTNPRRITE